MSMFHEIFGFEDSPAVTPVKIPSPEKANLPIDDPLFALAKSTGVADRLCAQLERDAIVTEITGWSPDERRVPGYQPSFRMPTSEEQADFIKSILGWDEGHLQRIQRQASETKLPCPCQCPKCWAGKCEECNAPSPCANKFESLLPKPTNPVSTKTAALDRLRDFDHDLAPVFRKFEKALIRLRGSENADNADIHESIASALDSAVRFVDESVSEVCLRT